MKVKCVLISIGGGSSCSVDSEGRRTHSGEGRSQEACKFSQAGEVSLSLFFFLKLVRLLFDHQ